MTDSAPQEAHETPEQREDRAWRLIRKVCEETGCQVVGVAVAGAVSRVEGGGLLIGGPTARVEVRAVRAWPGPSGG